MPILSTQLSSLFLKLETVQLRILRPPVIVPMVETNSLCMCVVLIAVLVIVNNSECANSLRCHPL